MCSSDLASAELKGNKEIVKEAVTHYGSALQYASAELRGDQEIVMEAVKQNGRALQYAPAEWLGDKKRSEERRGGKESRTRGLTVHYK